jgi:mRNA interferase RelE/StbE
MTYTVTRTPGPGGISGNSRPRRHADLSWASAGIREEPYQHVRKLAGFSGTPVYRFRVGRYRAVLTIEDDRLLILVLEAGDRSSVSR